MLVAYSMSSKLNILVAYPYMSKQVIRELDANRDKIEFLLDSGAFTAWKSGKPIHIDDYCRFLDSLPFKPWRYFTLDVIGDAEGTMKNYELMLSRGYNPVPIFTPSQDFDEIDYYYSKTDMIGAGGLVGKYNKDGLLYVNKLMKKVNGRKIHLLGYTKSDFLKHFKPYSCDSSSWSSSFRYASAKIYKGNGAWLAFTKKQLINKPSDELINLIKRHGVDPSRLAQQSEWSNGNKENEYAIETLTHRTWVKYQKDIEKNISTKLFLACSTEGQVKLMVRAYDWMNNE